MKISNFCFGLWNALHQKHSNFRKPVQEKLIYSWGFLNRIILLFESLYFILEVIEFEGGETYSWRFSTHFHNDICKSVQLFDFGRTFNTQTYQVAVIYYSLLHLY